jgi:hypothetical protein
MELKFLNPKDRKVGAKFAKSHLPCKTKRAPKRAYLAES